MLSRITFVTIGQTPRDDLVPEIVGRLPVAVEIAEKGALDGLAPEAIAALGPGPDDHALVTRLRDGSQVVVAKRRVQARLQAMLDTSHPGPREATVLLCTGHFPGLSAPGLFFDAQHLVDHGVAALAGGASPLGLVLPLARQEAEFHLEPSGAQEMRMAHASPYQDADFEAVGRSLAECALVVMHCMGYTEAQRSAIARASGRPVLLARRLVASALSQLL